jgi:DNA-binding MurR/RpiR family transcriptional regulator
MLEFARIGINCTSYPDPHIQTISAALLGAEDAAVVFSHSGSTKDMLSAARAVKASGANLICVTSSFRSPISKIADVILLASVGESTVVSSFCPKIGQLIILERLFAGCIKKMGKEAQERINRTTHAILDKMY